jgi:hypothetical protein
MPPTAKVNRRRRNTPELGEWVQGDGNGWAHGDIPEPPDGLKEPSLEAWRTWFSAWFATHWTPDDVPGLRLVIRMYDDVERGTQTKAADRASLHAWMRSYGITPDGQQKLRWQRPTPAEVPSSQSQPSGAAADKYAHLTILGEERTA